MKTRKICGWVLVSMLCFLGACSPKSAPISDKKIVGDQFMDGMSKGDKEVIQKLTVGTKNNLEAVQIIADAIAMKKRGENIKDFHFEFVSESGSPDDTTKGSVVYSQLIDGKKPPENIVLDMVFDENAQAWRVNKMQLR